MKKKNGITLIALVISIIVLLILSGTSITLISENNSILEKVEEAKEETEHAKEDEEDEIAMLSSYANIKPANRKGINVGDYIQYISPTEQVTLNTIETGARKEQTLPRKDIFRVLDKDKYGNLILIGAMSSKDKQIAISGSLGYNNGIYTLNKKCNDLYKNPSKGITARCIKKEDIISRFGKTAKDRMNDISKSFFNSIEKSGSVTKNKDNLTMTYKNKNTGCPDIFQYEKNGKINDVPTLGLIEDSESYKGYRRITKLKQRIPIPKSLTVKYSALNLAVSTPDDFSDKNNANAYKDMFFGTDAEYWLASRCISCGPDLVFFDFGRVYKNYLNGAVITWSYKNDGGAGLDCTVCPIVYIPYNVEIEISNNPKNQYNLNGTLHRVK